MDYSKIVSGFRPQKTAWPNLAKEVVPVSISWSREEILDFLKKRYASGDDKAEQLLKVQLWLDVQKKLYDTFEVDKDKDPIKRIEDAILSFPEFPSSIAQETLTAHLDNVHPFELSNNCDTQETEELPV